MWPTLAISFVFVLASHSSGADESHNRGGRSLHEVDVVENPEYLPEESAGLFIGVRRTDDHGFSEVPFAADDAADLAHLFSVELGLIPPERVIILLAGSPQKPATRYRLQQLIAKGARRRPATQAEIYRQVTRQSAIAGRRGFLLAAVASHGIHRDGIDFLVAQDTVPARIERTGIAAQEIFSGISESTAPRRLVLVDACRERVTGLRSGMPEPKSALSPSMIEAMAQARGQVVLMATTEGGFSFDDPLRSNGVFTAEILRGLRGAAPADKNGWITAGTLADFVDREVRRWVQVNRPQFAHVSRGITRGGDVSGRHLPLASIGPRPESDERVAIELSEEPGSASEDSIPVTESPALPSALPAGKFLLADVLAVPPSNGVLRGLELALRRRMAKAADWGLCIDLEISKGAASRETTRRWIETVRGSPPAEAGELEELLASTLFDGAVFFELRDNPDFEELQIAAYMQSKGSELVLDSRSRYGSDRFDLDGLPVSEILDHLCEVTINGESRRFALIDAEVYDGPGFWGTKRIGKLEEGQRVQVLRVVEDSAYWEILLNDGRTTGFVPKSAVGSIRGLMRRPLRPNEASRLRWDDLLGLWIRERKDVNQYGKAKHTLILREFTESESTYNGQESVFQVQSRRLRLSRAGPLSWDLGPNGALVWIEQWTDITDEGHRMKWDLRWKVRHWNPERGELEIEEILLGAGHRSEETWFRCDAVRSNRLRKACLRYQRQEFEQ